MIRHGGGVFGIVFLVLMLSCGKPNKPETPPPAGFVDRTFYSPALRRDVTYRAMYPASASAGEPVHVLYLLHGNGESYRTWSMAKSIATDYVLIMPEGHSSYFMNSVGSSSDSYEDFLTQDLIGDAERGLNGPVNRALIGNSMGGFAAIVLAMKHPALYRFAAALSPPVDYPERPFAASRLSQSLAIRSIFGPPQSATRRAGDPFELAATTDAAHLPYLWLSCGDQEPLLAPIRRFDSLLTRRHIRHDFDVVAGGHNWAQWNDLLPVVMSSLQREDRE